MIDLDANATTPIHPAALAAMADAFARGHGNPSSAHANGRIARQLLDDARDRIAACLDCKPGEIVVTSGATEANNLAIFGLTANRPGRIVSSPAEHPCVVEPIRLLEKAGRPVTWVSPKLDGRVAIDDVRIANVGYVTLIAIMLANHETGAINDVAAMAGGTTFHCDASQAVGKIPVSFRKLGVTSLSASAHKFGGPPGVGILILKNGSAYHSPFRGGPQQASRRPGTEPVALAVGMATALEIACQSLPDDRQNKAMMWDGLRDLAAINGPAIDDPASLPQTLNLSFHGCRTDLLLMALDQAGIAASAGSACASGAITPSPVLKAMGLGDDRVRSAIRFSWTRQMTDEEMRSAIGIVRGCVAKVRM